MGPSDKEVQEGEEEKREEVGREIPLKKEGILGNSEVFHDTLYLMDPPTSEPMPKGVPAAPMRAPSPPDEPPAVREVWYGLQVLPYTGLAASNHIMR